MANENDSAVVREMLSVPEPLTAEFFRRNSHRIIDDSNYWNVLGVLWKKGGTVLQQDLWRPLFLSDRRGRHKLMKGRERQRWRNLPKVVTAYRAVNHPGEAETAICWTLDRKVAERFSQGGRRQIVERQFRKEEVFAFFDRRGEEEILVNLPAA